tara:strand:- start:9631 stop:10059 length:429 start_codon:yes stop_codon:yes gene_type:complete
MYFIRLSFLILISIYIFGCNEKTTFSGKIITEQELSDLSIKTKSELINKFGQPSYIDSIQNKYFYYTEKNKKKNFYNSKIEYSYLFVFELDTNDNVINKKAIDLLDNNNSIYQSKETENNIIERGLLEKIFGGVGANQLPDS